MGFDLGAAQSLRICTQSLLISSSMSLYLIGRYECGFRLSALELGSMDHVGFWPFASRFLNEVHRQSNFIGSPSDDRTPS